MAQTLKIKTMLILVGSPRRDGNSAILADVVRRGAEQNGVEVKTRFVDDHISGFLRDCRQCRSADGSCSIDDTYHDLLLKDFLPADGVVFASPLYWYGVSAQMKSFFDRTFCYYSAAYPDADRVVSSMIKKRLGLVLASEESFPGAIQAPVHQIQEYARYTRSDFVGVVQGVGNSRGDVNYDPANPLRDAESLGREFFSRNYSDYCLDTPRSARVWLR